MRLNSINKDYRLFTNIVVFVAIVISLLILAISYKDFQNKANNIMADTAIKAESQLEDSVSYAKNITNLIAKQIAEKRYLRNKDIASILLKIEPEIDKEAQNIFAWTLFDFINPKNQIIASSTQGVLKESITIDNKRRPWLDECRKKPWKLLSSGPEIGMISKESIISYGFGVTNKKGKFLGIISFGISLPKLKNRVVSQIYSPFTSIAVIDQDNSIIFTSDNFEQENISELQRELKKNNLNSGFVEITDKQFYYKRNKHNQFKILVGTNKEASFLALKSDFLPKILNTLYLTIFFLILLHFFRAKLLNPLTCLAAAADELSKGNLHVDIPKSEIDEVNSLALAINKVKQFLIAEDQIKSKLKLGKDSAESENYNKTEFLSSTAHELKNMLFGTINNANLLKSNIKNPSSDNHVEESISLADEIIKLGEESSTFVNDILDVNQAQTGDFKIEEHEVINLEDIVTRSINIIKHRAIRDNKNIVYKATENSDKELIAHNLDPRRVKQIIVNIISNSIKYSNQNSEINVTLQTLSKEDSNKINKEIEDNLTNNPDIDNRRISQLVDAIRSRQKPRISITIVDDGIGMSEQEINVATQKYKKIHNEFAQKVDSTGLGLSIVKYLVEAQGGLLIIESKINEGTTVKVIF